MVDNNQINAVTLLRILFVTFIRTGVKTLRDILGG